MTHSMIKVNSDTEVYSFHLGANFLTVTCLKNINC